MTVPRNIQISRGPHRLVSVDSGRATVIHHEQESEATRMARMRSELEAAATARTRESVAAERARWQGLWRNVEDALTAFVRDVESKVSSQLIELSLKVAETIIRRQLPDRDMLRDVIREVLDPLSDVQGVRVHLSPADAEALLEARGGGGPQSIADHVDVVADSSLRDGDVLIESRNGYFDARIEERLGLLGERLIDRYRNSQDRSEP